MAAGVSGAEVPRGSPSGGSGGAALDEARFASELRRALGLGAGVGPGVCPLGTGCRLPCPGSMFRPGQPSAWLLCDIQLKARLTWNAWWKCSP